jgi:hypothetical protein
MESTWKVNLSLLSRPKYGRLLFTGLDYWTGLQRKFDHELVCHTALPSIAAEPWLAEPSEPGLTHQLEKLKNCTLPAADMLAVTVSCLTNIP